MPKMRILVPVGLGGGKIGQPGEVHEVSMRLAIDLRECDQAEPAEDLPPFREVTILNRDPLPQNRDPKMGAKK